MADTRGMATQILRDMLNIGIARRTNPVEGDNDGAAASEEKEVVSEDSASDSTSVSSSAPSPPRNQLSRASDLASSDGYVTSSNESSTVKLSLEPVKQVVKLSEGDDTVSIYGNQVEIVASEASLLTTSATSSSKIKINPIVKYDWEPNYYYGNLIAYGKKFIAYTLKGNSGYVIRLLNPLTANRALIKGFTGMITDLAFAHRNSNTLACVDEGGTLYIWNVAEEDSKIQYTVKLIVEREDKELSEYHRVFWCSYMPDESEEEEASNNGTREDSNGSIAVTHDNQAEVYDFEDISTEILGKKVSIEEVRQSGCYLSIKDGHTKPITDGALSPDGCVLTTASEDGSVKFWQLSDTPSDGSPSSVYCFQPHDGAPVSCLLFCDNHLVQDKEIPMWRFMITGTNYNRELKIWCTVTWNCLQTISFTVPVGLQLSPDVQEEPCIKISMDLTASYLVLSDIKRKALCVLMLHQDAEEGRAHVTSLSEFLLTQPLLSFVIAKAKLVKQHSNGEQLETENLDDSDEYDDEIMNDDSELSKNFGVQLRLYCIHTKSMQELLVHFHPEPSVPPATPSSVSSLMNSEVAGIRDGLSDLSGVETEASSTDVEEQEAVPAVGVSTARLKLITPDAFTQTLNKRGTRPDTAISVSSSVTTVTSVNNSHPSVDDRSASSISSNLSDSTLKSSMQETPRSSFSMENGRSVSPTSLPLPMTPIVDEVKTPISLPSPKASPVQLAPDPSAIPMPAFQSTPFCPGPDAETEREAEPRAKQVEFPEAQEEEVSPAAVERSSPFSGNEKDVEVEMEDSPKEDHLQGASLSQEDLPAQEKDRSRPYSRELTPTPLDERPLISLTEDDTRDVEPEQDERIEINILQESVQPSDVELLERASLNYFTSAPLSSPPFDRVSKRELKEQNISLVTSPQSTINIAPEQTAVPEVNTSLQATLDQILSIVQSQQQEIMDLKQQLRQQQTFQNQAVVRMLHEEMKRIESVVTTRVQTALADHAKEENQRLEKALRERHQADKKKQEQLQNTVSQSVTTAVAGKVEKAVKGEMKNSVVPAVQKLLTPVQEQMNVTITQKLTAADTVLKDSIGKMVRSKPVIEAIGAATVNALQGPIQAGYRETFQNTILPSFEKATQSMFQQINDSFQRGTQHYLQQVSGSLNQLSKEQKDARDPIVQQLQSQVNEFQVASEQLSSQMEMNVESAMQNVLQSQFPSILRSHREELLRKLREETLHTIQDTLGRDMREILMEHTQHLSELSSLDRSRQRDPMQQQMEITRLIEGGLPAEAFKEALTAEDLQLVVYVCQNVDPGELFSQHPLPLAQPILLSLIQQLSVDLSSDTEIKYSYLQEALMALDSKDEVTREHLPTVLLGLKQQLTSTAKDSTGQLGKMSRMLLMLAESLMK